MTITLALKRYVQWNIVRLGVLEVAIVVNLLCYYLTLSSTGNLCMLIGLTASLFCLPSEKRLRNELHIAKKKSYETVLLDERSYLSSCGRTGRYGYNV